MVRVRNILKLKEFSDFLESNNDLLKYEVAGKTLLLREALEQLEAK